ncbi:maleylpyruvate isomerase N-terminal domain-containing protein [Streptomyces sp. CC208A]|uniref:maleylpyruvate isomerase N-terminal domain-containing protein n=1 Tax=Streptomyces sp. CC208A TaxID=3044573 RepID=UPI0024A7AE5D|nr:maleylpyruvate isomerase N-terminal domain-containing protein [Streptomyces sp. CC208A]
MITSWPELVTAAAAETTAVLEKGADQSWQLKAGDLDWTCRATLDHIALGVVGYAGLLIAQPTDRYITLFASIDPSAPIRNALEGLRISGSILASAVREASPDVRAWHPYGHSDGPGFAAMGVLELTVHTRDIAQGLGFDWAPSDEMAAPVVERLFPDAPTGFGASDTLLWCTGRTELPGLPRRRNWKWNGTVR